MKYSLRMTAAQHAELHSHLFPGDGREAVALLLCGRRGGEERHVFTVRRVHLVPYELCDRHHDRVTWPSEAAEPLLKEAYGKGQAVVKIHGHGLDYRQFSPTDDQSDRLFYAAVANFLDDSLPQASLIMLNDGETFGRVLGDEGRVLSPLSSIMSIGHDLRFCAPHTSAIEAFMVRHAQAFGARTAALLRRLSFAVVGCSGTGSIVAEQLARLGAGRLVLVDPDSVEEKNLNRILNTRKEDAYLRLPKVQVLASAIARVGFGQEVLPLHMNLINPEAVMRVAECDVIQRCHLLSGAREDAVLTSSSVAGPSCGAILKLGPKHLAAHATDRRSFPHLAPMSLGLSPLRRHRPAVRTYRRVWDAEIGIATRTGRRCTPRSSRSSARRSEKGTGLCPDRRHPS